MTQAISGSTWWANGMLKSGKEGLEFSNIPIIDLVKMHGTPLYVYSASVIKQNIDKLSYALTANNIPFKIYYAMKANRNVAVLKYIHSMGNVGIDACSPREVQRAIRLGFSPQSISVTASMLSNRDMELCAKLGMHMNLDSYSALKRWSQLANKNCSVGLRVDPSIQNEWGVHNNFSYSKSKFGFDLDSIAEVYAYATSLGLEVDQIHMHPGWGMQSTIAPSLAQVYSKIADVVKTMPTVKTINVGGGLCCQHSQNDNPLTVNEWATLIRQYLLPTGCNIACEPGTYIIGNAGLLISEVNTVETRRGDKWIGLDIGYNINCYAVRYGIELEIIRLNEPYDSIKEVSSVAGNINEPCDVFAKRALIPVLQEGDYVALYPAGAYGSSMLSNHCMRGLVKEVLI